MRGVCPATVTVLTTFLSKWECDAKLRLVALKCLAKMMIVLHRSSPAERQIDLLTICQLYLDVINSLLKTKLFLARPFDEKFDLAGSNETYVDLNALTAVIDNIECMLSESQSRAPICFAMIEANFVPILINIPKQVKQWEIDGQKLAACVIRSLVVLSRTSPMIVNNLQNQSNIDKLFGGIRSLGKPSKTVVERCIELAYNDNKNEVVFGEVVTNLIEWIKDMHPNEQIYVADRLLAICVRNLVR